MSTPKYPRSSHDTNLDLKLVKFWSEDAFKAITSTVTVRRSMPWVCEICHTDLSSQQSVGCECCLNWYYCDCAHLRSAPKCKYWYCKNCKNWWSWGIMYGVTMVYYIMYYSMYCEIILHSILVVLHRMMYSVSLSGFVSRWRIIVLILLLL